MARAKSEIATKAQPQRNKAEWKKVRKNQKKTFYKADKLMKNGDL